MTTKKKDRELPNGQLHKREETSELSITNKTGNFRSVNYKKKDRELQCC